MPKKLIYMLWFVGLLLIIFVAYSAVTFERKPLVKSPEMSVETPKKNPYAITDVVQNNVEIPIIDPSVCADNPEGYIYFQIGDEVFRYTKDSPIQISWINSGSHEREGKDTRQENVPEGCRDNPYLGIVLIYSYKDFYEKYKKIKLINLSAYVDRDAKVSPGQNLAENTFNSIKKLRNNCKLIDNDTEKCSFPNEKEERYWPRAYRSELNPSMGKPYYLECNGFVEDVKCSAYYRLYPSFNIGYSFYISENENFEDSELIKFDSFLRNAFESMRVTIK